MAQTGYSRAVQERAAALVAISDRWARGYRIEDGLQFVTFTSQSAPGVFYRTRIDGQGCTCPAARLSRAGRCCHQLACRMVAEQAREAATPKAALGRMNELLSRQLDDRTGNVSAF